MSDYGFDFEKHFGALATASSARVKAALKEAKTTATYDEAFDEGHSYGYEEGVIMGYLRAKQEAYESLKKTLDEVGVDLSKIAQTLNPAGMQEANEVNAD